MNTRRRVRYYPTLIALLGVAGFAACASEDEDGGGGAGGATVSSSADSTSASTTATTASSTSTASSSSASSTANTSVTASSTGTFMNTCGNDIIEEGETCEGSDFDGKACVDFGFSGGSLTCNTFCNIVVSQCIPKESCNNANDDDDDGLVDCDDDDCATAVSCTDPCSAPTFLQLGFYEFLEITGEPDTLSSSCVPSGGREAIFQVTAATDDDMAIRFTPYDFAASLSVRTDCDDPTTEVVCLANAPIGNTTGLGFPVTSGQTYYIIAEALATNASGFYEIMVDQPPPETFCYDLWDDDSDGYLDCDDPTNCQGISSDCTPGAGPLASPCFSHNECAATGGDPVCLDSGLGFGNGYCSEFCDTSADCTNGTCVDINLSVHGVCFKNCATSNDCPAGTFCVDSGLGQTICDKPPEISCQDWQDDDADDLVDCEDPSACKGVSPNCTPGSTAPGGVCQIHNQCTAGQGDPFCIEWWPGGYCSEFCDIGLNDCPSGSQCSDWLNFSSGNGLCLDECSSSNDCRPGYFCSFEGVCVW